MLNRITLMGRLTHDPEIRQTQTGLPVCTFNIACQRDYKAGNAEVPETDFIDIVAWRHTAEFVGEYIRNGRMVVVDGRLQIRDWTDRYGNKRRTAEILANSVNFGDSKPQSLQEQSANAPVAAGATTANEYDAGYDLPF